MSKVDILGGRIQMQTYRQERLDSQLAAMMQEQEEKTQFKCWMKMMK